MEAVFLEWSYPHRFCVCSSVIQAEWFAEVPNSAVVSAKLLRKKGKIVDNFKSGKLKQFNVGVLLLVSTTLPWSHCFVEPTRSVALYYQMLGRGVRPYPGKKTCYVIDMSGTVKSLGRIETIKLVKNQMWELESEKGSWHNKPLYSFAIKK